MRLKLPTLLFALALLLSGAPVQAHLAFFLKPAEHPRTVGNEVVFTGTLINTSRTETLFLNNIRLNFINSADGQFTTDTNVFFANVPGILRPAETYRGVVFAIVLNPATPPGRCFGIVAIQGGANIFSTTTLGTQPWGFRFRCRR
jgi:hypothetical protein